VKFTLYRMSRCIVSTCIASACASAMAQQPSATATYASDDNRLDGDHLHLRTNAHGFTPVDGSGEKCAPVESKLSVRSEASDGTLVVRFYHLPDNPGDEALKDCPKSQQVNTITSYKINKTKLMGYDFRRTGVTFGGLVVPFKFRLGGDKGITASSTIAPYVGFRMAFFQGFGLSFTPLISGGLGLVPVTDQNTNTTETKSALSLATGFIMTSSKSERFNAGILIGKDVLSKTDRERDPNVDKAWLSFYLGISM
jgi:hypothetical protein